MDERIIVKKLEILRELTVERTWELGRWQAREAEHVALGEYHYEGDWVEVPERSYWRAGKTVFFRTKAEVPLLSGSNVLYLHFNFEGMEGLLFVNGKPYAGLDGNHRRVPVPGAGEWELEVEFSSVPHALFMPHLRGEFSCFKGARIIAVNPQVEAAYYDLRFAFEASRVASDERRKRLLHGAIEAAMLAIDLAASRERVLEEIEAGRRVLNERLSEIAPDPEAGRIFLVGHTHIDTAWLWQLKETVRKCGRTFSTACRLMERYPHYHFACSQAQLYAYTQKYYPALYEEMKRWVAKGHWETAGAMWVESDCNVVSGESLIRQILYGLRFYGEELGTRPRICWLPDVFGYPASLPQILVRSGMKAFMTCKLHWQARNPFPYHLFWWQGIDGTRILAHIPKLAGYYNGNPSPEQLTMAWNNYLQKAEYPEVLFPFGYGDGGGGATEEMLEYAARAERFPGLPAARFGTAEQYFEDVLASSPELPVWNGELYLETHRGTYTTQGAIKRANRKNELLYREAEILGSIARALGHDVQMEPLREGWEKILVQQFHDILPGSSIGEVYEDAAKDHAEAATIARAVIDQSLTALVKSPGETIFVFNSLSWQRTDVVKVVLPDRAEPMVIVDSDGNEHVTQVVSRRDGRMEVVFVAENVPSVGYASFAVRRGQRQANSSLKVEADGRTIENQLYRLELAEDGSIARLLDKRFNREVVPVGERANRLQLFQDGPEREAAWNVHATFEKREYPWEGETRIEVVECGGVRAMVRVVRTHRQSRLEQDVVLYDRLPRIDFVTRFDWHERQTMLKAAFPVEVLSPKASFEVQFGAVERPTHHNTSWEQEKFEVCAHRWIDISEAGWGVSLLNDCKYGHDVKDNVLRITLLRGAEFPDPLADVGRHEFVYSLLPHAGDWREGETVRRGCELNVPLIGVAGSVEGGRISYFEVETDGHLAGHNAVIETLKPAEDGDGFILRIYEAHGGRGNVQVRSILPIKRVKECNLVEEDEAELAVEDSTFTFSIRPFEVKTFRLRTG